MTSRAFGYILRAVERGAFPKSRKWAWKRLYNMLSRLWRDSDWRFMNYGYLPAGDAFALAAEDEPERAFIGLYHQAMAGLAVEGARVLEVGSGRGGGARYIARYMAPAAVTGLDYSPETVRRARQLNDDTANLVFEVGDAEALPFADASFDIVVNIESSHCYANVPAFAREVARVLAPGGCFTWADMRAATMIEGLDRDLGASGLVLESETNLSPGVVSALDAVNERKMSRIQKSALMRRFLKEFSGAKGSLLYRNLQSGGVVYLARRYRKPAQ